MINEDIGREFIIYWNPKMLTRHSKVSEFIHTTLTGMGKRELGLLPQLKESKQPDLVHDFRVEIRRLRSVLGSCSPLVDQDWLVPYRQQLKVVDEMISPLRNAQVLLNRFRKYPAPLLESNAGFEASLEMTLREREAKFQLDMQSQEFVKWIESLNIENLQRVPTLNPENEVHGSLKAFNKEQWKSLSKSARDSTPDSLHKVRIKAKKVRYLAGASIPVLGDKMEKHEQDASQIQQLLGELQDSRMMIDLVDSGEICEFEKRESKRLVREWRILARESFE